MQCQAAHCDACYGAHGACRYCQDGWSLRKGACVKAKQCLVPGCALCDSDPSRCDECESQYSEMYECAVRTEFDPRTRTCVKLDEYLEC